MQTFQRFFLKNTNEKELESYIGQKVNSKREKEQEMLMPCKNQKVDAKKDEYSTFRAQKNRKNTSTTYVNAENAPKNLYFCTSKLLKDTIRVQSEQYP